jgi:hypothetical protein
MAFCDSRGFRVLGHFFSTPAEYETNAFNLTDQVRFNGVAVTDNALEKNIDFEEKILPTIYNGYCKASK